MMSIAVCIGIALAIAYGGQSTQALEVPDDPVDTVEEASGDDVDANDVVDDVRESTPINDDDTADVSASPVNESSEDHPNVPHDDSQESSASQDIEPASEPEQVSGDQAVPDTDPVEEDSTVVDSGDHTGGVTTDEATDPVSEPTETDAIEESPVDTGEIVDSQEAQGIDDVDVSIDDAAAETSEHSAEVADDVDEAVVGVTDGDNSDSAAEGTIEAEISEETSVPASPVESTGADASADASVSTGDGLIEDVPAEVDANADVAASSVVDADPSASAGTSISAEVHVDADDAGDASASVGVESSISTEDAGAGVSIDPEVSVDPEAPIFGGELPVQPDVDIDAPGQLPPSPSIEVPDEVTGPQPAPEMPQSPSIGVPVYGMPDERLPKPIEPFVPDAEPGYGVPDAEPWIDPPRLVPASPELPSPVDTTPPGIAIERTSGVTAPNSESEAAIPDFSMGNDGAPSYAVPPLRSIPGVSDQRAPQSADEGSPRIVPAMPAANADVSGADSGPLFAALILLSIGLVLAIRRINTGDIDQLIGIALRPSTSPG